MLPYLSAANVLMAIKYTGLWVLGVPQPSDITEPAGSVIIGYVKSLFGVDVSGAHCASGLLDGVLMPSIWYINCGHVWPVGGYYWKGLAGCVYLLKLVVKSNSLHKWYTNSVGLYLSVNISLYTLPKQFVNIVQCMWNIYIYIYRYIYIYITIYEEVL